MPQTLLVPPPSKQAESKLSPSSLQFNSRFSNWSYHGFSIFQVLAPSKQDDPVKREVVKDDGEVDQKTWDEHPRNPRNWSAVRKSLHMFIPICLAIITSLSSTTITSTQFDDDNIQNVVWNTLPFSLYILGMGVGSLIGSSCSELFSKRISLWIAIPIFSLMQLGAGLSRSAVFLILFRFLAGLFGGTCFWISFSLTTDLWAERRRTAPIVAFFVAALTGSSFGPLFGAVVEDKIPKPWIHYVFTLVVVPLIPITYFTNETAERCIRNDLPDLRRSFMARTGLFMEYIFVRPSMALIKEPSVFFLGCIVGFGLSIAYSMAASVPHTLAETYNLNIVSSTLCYLSLAIGTLVGSIIHLIQHSNIYRSLFLYWKSSQSPSSVGFPPRYRLIPALPSTVLLPLSLLFFAFTVIPGYSIFIPLSFLVLLGCALFLLFVPSFLFIHDHLASEKRATGLATFVYVSQSIGATLPLGFGALSERLGLRGTYGVLAAGMAVLGVVVWTLWVRGKRKDGKTEG